MTELARARIAGPTRLPADVVTIGSTVTYRDETSGRDKNNDACLARGR